MRRLSTSSRAWNDLPPTEQVGDAARLQGLDEGPGDVLVEAREAPEEEAHVARRRGARARSGRSRSVTRQPLSLSSQETKAATASGSEAFIAVFVSPRPPYGRGTGSATTEGCPAIASRCGRQGDVGRLERGGILAHDGLERGVDERPGRSGTERKLVLR